MTTKISDTSEKTCLQKVFDVLSEITWEKTSEAIVQKAKDCIADYLSVCFAGAETESSKKLLSAMGGNLKALKVEDLGMWLGSTSRMLDMDDGHRLAFGHPGPAVVSGSLAALRMPGKKADGKRFLLSLCKGYELYGYLGRAVNPSSYMYRGFDSTSLCGTAASAIAAGTAIGFSDEIIFNAVAIALMHSGGILNAVEDGSDPKYLCVGWADKISLVALQLAAAGLKGPIAGLEGRRGFYSAHTDEKNDSYWNNPQLNWEISSVYFKKYACVRRIHTTLDILSDIVKEHHITLDMVDHLDILSSSNLISLNKYEVPHVVAAQSSMPFCATLFLEKGEVTEETMTKCLFDEKLRGFMPKVRVIEDEKFNKIIKKVWAAVEVIVVLKDGTQLSKRMDIPYGDPGNPHPDGFLKGKFFRLLEKTPLAPKREHIWQQIQQFDTLEDVNQEFFEPLLSMRFTV